MAKKKQARNIPPPLEQAEAMGQERGDRPPPPEPSPSAAASAGAVGPGALAAAEQPGTAPPTAIPPERPTKGGDAFTAADREALRSLIHRAGGMEAFIRWLKLHPELE
jgi:hypothetical protein